MLYSLIDNNRLTPVTGTSHHTDAGVSVEGGKAAKASSLVKHPRGEMGC